jgi:hypothetical protein
LPGAAQIWRLTPLGLPVAGLPIGATAYGSTALLYRGQTPLSGGSGFPPLYHRPVRPAGQKKDYKGLMAAFNNAAPLPNITRFNWKDEFYSTE